MNEGWICPRCKKVNAPDIKQCDCKYENHKEEDFIEKLKELGKEEEHKYKKYPYDPYRQFDYYPDWRETTLKRPFWIDWFTIC